MIIHHTSGSGDFCKCGYEFQMIWHDAEEHNGFREFAYGFDKLCETCFEKETGSKPKTLQELNLTNQ